MFVDDCDLFLTAGQPLDTFCVDWLKAAWTEVDVRTIAEVFDYVSEHHAGQVRKGSQAPYVIHPVHVAAILGEYYGTNLSVLRAALCHDLVEDTAVTLDDIEERYGPEVRELVDGVTTPVYEGLTRKEKVQAEAVRFIPLPGIVHDIKRADNCCNVVGMCTAKPSFAAQYAREKRIIHRGMERGTPALEERVLDAIAFSEGFGGWS